MNLIDDVAGKVEGLFQLLWPYQNQTEFFRTREIEKEGAYFRRLAEMSEEERQAEVLKAGEKTADVEAQRGLFKKIGQDISDELCRLSPDTYPEEDPGVAASMVDFLTRFSKAYSKEGKQRSAGPILEYILAADYDHAWWLWDRWVASCIAVGDHESAEALLAAATDGSTPAATAFARGAGKYKPKAMVAKAMIAIRRDGDLELAHTIANAARLSFGESRDAIQCFRGLTYVRQEVAKGVLEIQMNTGANGGVVHELVNKRLPATALLTGKWEA